MHQQSIAHKTALHSSWHYITTYHHTLAYHSSSPLLILGLLLASSIRYVVGSTLPPPVLAGWRQEIEADSTCKSYMRTVHTCQYVIRYRDIEIDEPGGGARPPAACYALAPQEASRGGEQGQARPGQARDRQPDRVRGERRAGAASQGASRTGLRGGWVHILVTYNI